MRHMGYRFAKQVIDRLREMTKDIPSKDITIAPVGLGEPLLHLRYFDLNTYIRELFPEAIIHANTNCINLEGKIADRLTDSELDILRRSIGFNDAETYRDFQMSFGFIWKSHQK